MRYLRAATQNLSPESSAQCKDFNLKRVLFYHGNLGGLFQQNRPKAALRGSQQLARWRLSDNVVRSYYRRALNLFKSGNQIKDR
jgi:hypothetical protein